MAPNTVKRHLHILEALYIVFRVYPHARDIARALGKRPKLSFFDTGLVRGDRGKAFENLVAVCLLKLQSRLEDMDGRSRALRNIRTKEGREVDFLLVDEETPKALIEAKWGDREPSPQPRYFRDRYSIEAIQLVAELRQDYDSGGIALRRAADWLASVEV